MSSFEPVTLNDRLITEALVERSSRSPDWQAEAQGMQRIAQQVGHPPERLLQTLTEIALELCPTGTAGVSLLENTSEEECFHIPICVGRLTQFTGMSLSRHTSPCGICLDRGTPQLFSQLDRAFTEAQSSIVEALVLPLKVNNQFFGAVWILSHTEERHFDSEDVRLLTNLANFTALCFNQQTSASQIDKIQQTEAQLSETQRRLELSLSGANLGTWTYHVATDTFWADDRALILQGHALGEAKTFAEAGMNIHPDDYDRSLATFAAALQTRSNLQMEYRVIWRDDSVHWIASYAEFVPIDGTFYGVVQDITEAKRREIEQLQTETALRQSEERFRAFVTASSDVVYRMSADWREMRYLDGKQFLINTENPSQSWIETYIPPDDRSSVWTAIENAIQTKSIFELEHRVIQQNGTIGWTFSRAIPMLNEQGEIVEWFGAASDVTERKQAEAALRGSEAKYRSLFNSIDEGYFLCDVIFDETDQPVDLFYVDENPAAVRMTGQSFRGQRLREMRPNYEKYWYEIFGRVARTGQAERMERYAEPDQIWCDFYVFKVGGDDTRQVAVVFNDITDRKERERQQEFLLKLGDALRSLSDAVEIQRTAMHVIGEYLGVDRAYYVDIEPDYEHWVVADNYMREGATPLIGRGRVNDFGWAGKELLAGRILSISDVNTDPNLSESARTEFRAVGVAALLAIPLIKEGRWAASFALQHLTPREWSEAEIKLLQETAERTWAAVERTKAEAALRESEEKFAALFASSPVPFMVLEPNAPDFTITTANEAYFAATLTTPEGLIGRRLFDVFTDDPDRPGTLGSEALERSLDRVLRTRRPDAMERTRYDIVTPDGGFEPHWWLAINAPLLDASGEVTAIIHQATRVTELHYAEEAERENQERQAFLLKLGEILQQFVQPNDIKAAAMRLLGEHLGVSRAQYHECDRSGEYYSADGVGYANGLPLLDLKYRIDDFGTFVNENFAAGRPYRIDDLEVDPRVSAEERDAYRTYQIRAGAGVPLIRGGKLVAILAIHNVHPHPWTDLEIDLIRETAERIWTPVERARAEEALRESEENYRSLFTTMDQGFCIVEKVETSIGEPSDFRYLTVNPAFERHTGMHNVVGQTIRELVPDAEQRTMDIYDEVVQTGRPQQFENYISAMDLWMAAEVFPAQQPGQIAILFSNISERKRAEVQLRRAAEMDAFRVKLSDALRSIADPLAIQREASRILRTQLRAVRVAYAEMHEDGVTCTALAEDKAEGAFSVFGQTFNWNDFDPSGLKTFNEGGLISREDSQTADDLTPTQKATFAAMGIRAFIGAPLVKSGRLVAFFLVHFDVPHQPAPNEIRMLEETADRTWASVERARAEQSLRTSEAKYRTLFTSIDEGFTLLEMMPDESGHRADFRIVETNPVWEQQTGLTDAVGKTLLEIAPNFEQPLLDFYSDVLRSGRGRRTEYYTSSVDRWYTVYASRIGGEKSRQLAVVFNDISDRKQRERQQEFLLKLGDAIRPLGDAEAVWLTAAQVLGRFLGACRVAYAEDGGDGETFVAFPNYVDGVPDVVGRYRYEDFGSGMESELRTGRARVHSDVTADERLSTAERQAFAAMGIGASINVPLVKNGQLVAFMGVNYSAAHDFPPHEVELVREVADRTWAAIERVRAEAAVRESELQRVREQSEREQERQRAESLAELDRAKTLFFSNVSHEFRTPLTLLLAPLQEVLNDRTLSPTNQERLELAHRSSLRLLKLVNTLLDFSRIEAGRMQAVYEPIDLAQLTAELASVFRSAIEQSGLRLVVDCSPLPEAVYVDREMWEKIILNLLSNAFKFTFAGEITVRLQSEHDHAIVQIEDTGTGIAPEHLPHLFERFYQVRGAQARTHEGSGIGLALVHELVRLQGGTIEVTSTVGVGTCFTIVLPFGTDHLPSERIERDRTLASTAMNAMSYVEEAERWLPGEDFRLEILDFRLEDSSENNSESKIQNLKSKILLVDDNADMREYLTRILSEHVQVEAVADGMTALRIAQAQVPDLILSDVMMPELDGFGLLQALRSDPRTREIPIILLSARAGEEAIVEGLEAGADDYLIKPFSAQELVSRVNAHLQMAQLRTTALQEARNTIQNRDELLSTVSHELNTPLVSILGWTRLLRSNPPSPSILTKALDTIERNATVQAALVQDLLDISRITAGKLRLNPQPVELKSIVEIAIATVAQSAEAKSIHLIWQPDQDALVRGDRDRLQQVFSNVLTNAIKFTPAGGRVTVELSTLLDRAEIRVIDTGIGIAAEFLPHVFDRFRQARSSDAAKGLGVGLAIARHLVELHHGTIRAESAGEGQGATFVISLPLLDEQSK